MTTKTINFKLTADDKISGAFNKIGGSVASLGKTASLAAVGGIAALGAGVATVGALSIKTAISFESAFAGVLKTTDGLTDSVGNLNEAGKDLRQGFVDLSKKVPLAFEELSAIGELGGQLGIGKESLIEFTDAVAALGVSTNLSTEEAAAGLARMSNIFNVETGEMGENIARLGSTIVALGNNFATTERDILAFGERIAGAGKIAGFTQADVFAIGTAMSSVGIEAEAGGTAVQKVMLKINSAINGATTGFVDNSKAIGKTTEKLTSLNAKLVKAEAITGMTGAQILQMRDEFIAAGNSAEDFGRMLGDSNRKSLFDAAFGVQQLQGELELLREEQGKPVSPAGLQEFARVAGLTANEFSDLWEKDASDAFNRFVVGLGKEGDNAEQVLRKLELSDQRLIRAFLSLSGAGDLLENTLALGNDAFSKNSALQTEAAQRYATTESQLMILKNTLRATGDIIGAQFLPLINDLVTDGQALIERFAEPLGAILETSVVPSISSFLGTVREGSPLVLQFFSDLFDQVKNIGDAFQSGGLSGAIAKLFEGIDIGSMVGGLISQIPDALSGLVDSVTAYLVDNWPMIQTALTEWSTQFWEWTNTAISGAGTALAGILASIATWATGDGSSKLLELGQQLGVMLVDGLALALENQEKFTEVATKIITGIAAAVGAITATIAVIGGTIVAGIVSGILEKLGVDLQPVTIQELLGILKGIGDNIKAAAVAVGTKIVEGFKEGILAGVAEVGEAVNQLNLAITDSVKDALGISSPSTVFFGFGQNIVQGLIDGILSLAGNVGGLLSGIVGGGGDQQMPALNVDMSSLSESMGTATPESLLIMQESFTNTIGAITELLTVFVETTTEQWTMFVSMLTTTTGETTALLSESLMLFAQTTTELFMTFLTNLTTTWQTAWSNIQNILATTSPVLISIAMTTAQGVFDAFKNKDWFGLGKSIGNGIISGLRSKRNAIIDLAEQIATAALKAAKKRLGVSSPSKEFAKVGESMMAGLEQGIKASQQMPLSATDNAIQSVINNASTKNFNLTINNPTATDTDIIADFNFLKAATASV